MPSSNTREYVRGSGDDLWRRSLYTYWKRAAPPPSLMAFDAPTREFCTIRRASTNTPLQALVLWNDEQFVEASRVLAQRTLTENGSDHDRLVFMFRSCLARRPQAEELEVITSALVEFRERFSTKPEDAVELTTIGETPVSADLDPVELASWTMIANAMLNLHETISQR